MERVLQRQNRGDAGSSPRSLLAALGGDVQCFDLESLVWPIEVPQKQRLDCVIGIFCPLLCHKFQAEEWNGGVYLLPLSQSFKKKILGGLIWNLCHLSVGFLQN